MKTQITGRFTHAEAADLAIVLRAGSLPAPVEIIQNLTVGASLGQDSINKGIYSGIIGTILVVGFMLLYYRISGLIANIGLLFNILFLFMGLTCNSADRSSVPRHVRSSLSWLYRHCLQ